MNLFDLSSAGGMRGADIAVGWVDSSGQVNLQVEFFFHPQLRFVFFLNH